MGREQCESRKQSAETRSCRTKLEGQSREPRQDPGPAGEASFGDLAIGRREEGELGIGGTGHDHQAQVGPGWLLEPRRDI